MLQARSMQILELFGGVTHKLKQPLAIISINSSNIRLGSEIDDLNSKSIVNLTSTIDKEVKYLSDIIDSFGGFIKKDKILKRVNLIEFLQNIVDIISFAYRDINISVELKASHNIIECYMVASEFSKIVISILSSSKEAFINYNIDKSKILIEVEQKQKNIIVKIIDNATNIENTLIDKIFRLELSEYDSIKRGFTLFEIDEIAKNSLNSKIEVESRDDGLSFIIEIPNEVI